MRWAFVAFDLGTNPALYEDPVGVEWFIFDDRRIDVLMFARLATLATEVANLPVGWKVPTVGNGQNRRVDRAAVEAKAIELVQASIVLPEDIDYRGDGPPGSNEESNPYQCTIDANSGPAGVKGWEAVPGDWTPVEAVA